MEYRIPYDLALLHFFHLYYISHIKDYFQPHVLHCCCLMHSKRLADSMILYFDLGNIEFKTLGICSRLMDEESILKTSSV